MPLFSSADRRFALALSQLAYCNPFLPCRIEFERTALGERFDPRNAEWNLGMWGPQPGSDEEHPNVLQLIEQCERVLERAGPRLLEKSDWPAADAALYEDLVLFAIYHRHRGGFERVAADALAQASGKVKVFDAVVHHARQYLQFGETVLPLWHELDHMMAMFFQIRRAFQNIYDYILGASRPAVELRAAVWQSIFSHDMQRYRRFLYRHMADFTTLVIGPSGTGKELVARAVGLSRVCTL